MPKLTIYKKHFSAFWIFILLLAMLSFMAFICQEVDDMFFLLITSMTAGYILCFVLESFWNTFEVSYERNY